MNGNAKLNSKLKTMHKSMYIAKMVLYVSVECMKFCFLSQVLSVLN